MVPVLAFRSWGAHTVEAVKMGHWARGLRMATDCSGLGAPEEAWSMLAQEAGLPEAECVFACDISPASRRWLELHTKPGHIFADLTMRTFGPDEVLATDLCGRRVRLTRDAAKLDLYVAGFMCTPFSDKGLRLGWQATRGSEIVGRAHVFLLWCPRCPRAHVHRGGGARGRRTRPRRRSATVRAPSRPSAHVWPSSRT